MLSQNAEIGTFIIITTALILLLICFIILIIFLYKKKQFGFHKNIEEIKDLHEKDLLTAKLEVQEETFKHISAEIHDNIGLILTLAKANLENIKWTNPADAAHKVTGSIEHLKKAIDDIRILAKILNYDYIARHGLIGALQLALEQIERLNMFETSLDLAGTPTRMDTERELIVFRIVQEALNNCIKHAGATQLLLKLLYTETRLEVEISDNGRGLNNSPGEEDATKGSGLENIYHRARLINATCAIDSARQEGTTIQLSIPIE